MLSKKRLFQALNGWIYIVFSVLGFYFIYAGDIFQKFNAKRSNFAEYDETVTEFPTIVTYVKTHANRFQKYGKDFNISLTIVSNKTYSDHNLTIGGNQMHYSEGSYGMNPIIKHYGF